MQMVMAVGRCTLTVFLDIVASKRDTDISRLFRQIEDTRELGMATDMPRNLETVQAGSMAGDVDVADGDQVC